MKTEAICEPCARAPVSACICRARIDIFAKAESHRGEWCGGDFQEAAEKEVAAPVLVLDGIERREARGVDAERTGQDRVCFRHTELDDRCQLAHEEGLV